MKGKYIGNPKCLNKLNNANWLSSVIFCGTLNSFLQIMKKQQIFSVLCF